MVEGVYFSFNLVPCEPHMKENIKNFLLRIYSFTYLFYKLYQFCICYNLLRVKELKKYFIFWSSFTTFSQWRLRLTTVQLLPCATVVAGRYCFHKHMSVILFTGRGGYGICGSRSLPDPRSHVLSGGRVFLVLDPFWGVGYLGEGGRVFGGGRICDLHMRCATIERVTLCLIQVRNSVCHIKYVTDYDENN